MLRALVVELAAGVSVALFVGTVLLWAYVL